MPSNTPLLQLVGYVAVLEAHDSHTAVCGATGLVIVILQLGIAISLEVGPVTLRLVRTKQVVRGYINVLVHTLFKCARGIAGDLHSPYFVRVPPKGTFVVSAHLCSKHNRAWHDPAKGI